MAYSSPVPQTNGSGRWQCATSPRAGGQAERYSQGERDVLALGHGAVQRDLESLVGLPVILGPKKVNLYLVMEDCREKVKASAHQP